MSTASIDSGIEHRLTGRSSWASMTISDRFPYTHVRDEKELMVHCGSYTTANPLVTASVLHACEKENLTPDTTKEKGLVSGPQ